MWWIFWILVGILLAIIIYWRWLMNPNQLLYTFIEKMIEKVDKEAFWTEHGDDLMALLVAKLF